MEVVGRKIVAVKFLDKKIVEKEYWGDSPHTGVALVLDDGSVIYPSQDEEGNGPGALFGMNKEMTESFYIMPISPYYPN
jgi:hypothetical protein